MTQTIDISALTLDPRCQPRQQLDVIIVSDYATAMTDGQTFPPVTVFRNGETFWLADGFHRVHAAQQAGIERIDATVQPGDFRDAVLHAVGANATHGLRRTNADKRRAVETLLEDPEWSKWSDNEIARRCAVHQTTVGSIRRSLMESISDESLSIMDSDNPAETVKSYTDRWGNERTMNTTNIGRKTSTPAEEAPRDDEPIESTVIGQLPVHALAQPQSAQVVPAPRAIPEDKDSFVANFVDGLPKPTVEAFGYGVAAAARTEEFRESVSTILNFLRRADLELSTHRNVEDLRNALRSDDVARTAALDCIKSTNKIAARLRDHLGADGSPLRRVS